MRKIIAMSICTVMFGIANMANAYSYTETMIIGKLLTTDIADGNTAVWTYTLPSTFDLKDVRISSATLLINAFSANGKIDVTANGEKIGKLKGEAYKSTNQRNNTFEFGDILTGANLTDGKLIFSVTANDKFVYLGDSVLTINYDNTDPSDQSNNNGGGNNNNNNNGNAPVPEPATLLLLGSGLSGLAFWGKRRRVAK